MSTAMSQRTILTLLIACLLGAMAPGRANAGFLNEPDESPKWFTTSLGVSWWFPAEDNTAYTSVYDPGAKAIWRLHVGFVPIARYVQLEVGASVGFHQKASFQVGATSSEVSGENIMMTLTPLRWGFKLGIDPIAEFPVVPYALLGWDYVLWREHSSSSEVKGGKGAWHYGFGVGLLLDRVEPRRASQNDALAGLNDAFLTIDATNVQYLKAWQTEGALDLTGWQLSLALKLDF
jgi:hypothetical protein